MSYDAAANSIKCYDFAIAVKREILVRDGTLLPRLDNMDEVRWRDEGPVSPDQLDSIRQEAVAA